MLEVPRTVIKRYLMEIATVVGLIILLAAAVLLMKVLGKVVSLVLSVVGIVALVWLVVASLRYLDERDIRDNFLSSNNLFILESEGAPITGFASKEGLPDPSLEGIEAELGNPNSAIYDDYYKVVVVKKEALPEKLALMVDAAEGDDRLSIFRSYVDDSLIEGDAVSNLVENERAGNIEVYSESLAFRHGVREVLTS
jgi:hypothetical protein